MKNKLYKFQSTVPEGKKGIFEVKKFIVSEEDASLHRLRCWLNRNDRGIEAGTYTKLTRNGQIIMSDTPAERRDHYLFVCYAKGKILINGLGLGLVVETCLQKKEVTHITVVEIETDIIDLVGLYLLKKYQRRLSIIHADALNWKPPKNLHYDFIWHDIWDEISKDNYESMKKLRRKYGKKTKWQDAWCAEYVKQLTRN